MSKPTIVVSTAKGLRKYTPDSKWPAVKHFSAGYDSSREGQKGMAFFEAYFLDGTYVRGVSNTVASPGESAEDSVLRILQAETNAAAQFAARTVMQAPGKVSTKDKPMSFMDMVK